MQSHDQKYLNGLILEQKKVEKDKRDEIHFAEKQAKNQKKIDKEALLDELVSNLLLFLCKVVDYAQNVGSINCDSETLLIIGSHPLVSA